MNNLQYRLMNESGSIVGAEPQEPEIISEYSEKALQLVADVFTRHHWPLKDGGAGMTPEIISERTLKKLEAMEEALEHCRNLMIDHYPQENTGRWEAAIDEAGEILGVDP